MANSDLTSSKAAERLGVAHSTVRQWCNRGLFPNAIRHETPAGSFWLIPEKDLKGFRPPERGRPAKANGTVKKGGKK
jgi:hypothetical protein